MSNNVIDTQLNHRSIRKFKEKRVPDSVINTLFEVAERTATSSGMQAASIIRIKDSNLKKEIANICTQDFISEAPELFILIIDHFRNSKIIEYIETEKIIYDMDKFISGFTDAILIAQNVVTAAESLDLGTVYLGSILNDSKKICQLLGLPKLTFPALGIAMGYPDQDPRLKPRLDMNLRVFENNYEISENYTEMLKEYNAEMKEYYLNRPNNARADDFTNLVFEKYRNRVRIKSDLVENIISQGFDIVK